jgi:hypothetical protein
MIQASGPGAEAYGPETASNPGAEGSSGMFYTIH